ncbi:hypothetical protein FAVG1_12853 [Fusarium avenaceum]|nr:hypothetical protein FAVG1_12853 [Fusarium avenaceum]
MSWQPQHHPPTSSGPSSQAPTPQSAPPDLTFLVATDSESLAAVSTQPLPLRPRADRNEAYSRKKQQLKEWLDTAWGGDSWLPTDLRQGLASFGLAEPAAGVTVALKDITRLTQRDSLHLDSLWHQGGILREAVSRDLQERANKPSAARSRPLKPHLTAAIAKSVLSSLRQSTPTPSFDTSFTPLAEQPDDDDDSDFEDFSPAPFDDNPTSATTATAAMSVPPAESRMDVDPVSNKRRLSTGSLASIRGDKKMRTAAFAAADTILTALSSSSNMSGDVMRILGRLLSAQSRDETDPSSLCWIDPILLQTEAASHPAQLDFLSPDHPIAVGIFTTLPSEHWCFAVLKQVGQTIHLRLHDCQPSDERLGIIKSHFEMWVSASAQSNGIQVVAETCPHLHGANWSSGLHALSCFRRTLRGESCSELMPFVAANEQKFHLDLIHKAIPSYLNNDECKILAAVQARQDDRDLINKSIEELNQQRA